MDEEKLYPVEVGGRRLLLAVRELPSPDGESPDAAQPEVDEHEIGSRGARLEPVLDGLAAFAGEFVGRFERTDATKITIQFGCEVAVESGTFIAVVGKASARSTVNVSLEWTRAAS